MMMVIEQPGIDVAFAKGGLNGGEVHGQRTILNKCGDLSESGGLFREHSFEERQKARPAVEAWAFGPMNLRP